MKKVVEIFTFKLAVGITDEAFATANENMDEWLRARPGFESRLLAQDKDGLWTDVVIWRSAQEAKQAAALFMAEFGDSDCMAMFDFGTVTKMYGELEKVPCE